MAPDAVALAVQVEPVRLRRTAFVPFAECAVAHPRLVVDLAGQAAALVPEAPGAGAQAVAVIAPRPARLAVRVPGLEDAAAPLAGGAAEQRVRRRKLDDPRRR